MRSLSRSGFLLVLLIVTGTSTAATAQTAEMAQDRPLQVQVREEYRVGGVEAPAWAALVDVGAAAFGPEGELWLVDTRGPQLVRVAPGGRQGEHLLRRGRGPGEFQRPDGLAVLADGSLVVGDIINSNLQHLNADGTLRLAVRTSGYLRSAKIAWLEGHDFIAVPDVYLVDGEASIRTAAGTTPLTRLPVLRFTLGREPEPRTIVTADYTQPPRARAPFASHAFQPRVHWTVHSGRIALVDGVAYDVRILDGAGRETGRIRRPIDARRPTRADIAAARAEARARLIAADGTPRVAGAASGGGAGGGSERNAPAIRRQIEAGLDAMTFAEVVPVILGLRYDADGRLWVARAPTIWGQPPILDVFSRNGEYLGSTRALPRLPDAFGTGGRAAFIEKDELDVPYVRVVDVALKQD